MKEKPFPVDQNDEDAFNKWCNSGGLAISGLHNTWDALEDIDKLLSYYGLEVVIWEAGSSDYWYSIQRRDIES